MAGRTEERAGRGDWVVHALATAEWLVDVGGFAELPAWFAGWRLASEPPPDGSAVLVYMPDREPAIELAEYSDGRWFETCYGEEIPVSGLRWLPLPDPPPLSAAEITAAGIMLEDAWAGQLELERGEGRSLRKIMQELGDS